MWVQIKNKKEKKYYVLSELQFPDEQQYLPFLRYSGGDERPCGESETQEQDAGDFAVLARYW